MQFRVTDAGRPVEAVYAQHSGAERCGVRRGDARDGRPVVFAAHGSHASYLRAGTRDRMWPDPNDEADGRGAVVAPAAGRDHARLAGLDAALDALGRLAGALVGAARAGLAARPGLPADRWDPEAFAASAGSCRAACDEVGECDGPEKALTVARAAGGAGGRPGGLPAACGVRQS